MAVGLGDVALHRRIGARLEPACVAAVSELRHQGDRMREPDESNVLRVLAWSIAAVSVSWAFALLTHP